MDSDSPSRSHLYPPHGLFITGTDTDVGKTFICSLIARELINEQRNIGIYKPACSGSIKRTDGSAYWQDVETLAAALEAETSQPLRELICPQCFHAPLAPPVAADLENREVDEILLRTGLQNWKNKADFLLVEGVGGLLCPISNNETIAHLAGDFKYPLLVVARANLGTINHTLLTLAAAKQHQLPVAGIILNSTDSATTNDMIAANIEQISRFTNVPVLSIANVQQTAYLLSYPKEEKIDWSALANTGEGRA